MELASMLSGERFTDRPASVCPIVGAILRAYNDNVDDRRRQDLYRFAAEAVGTRGDFALQRRRAEAALAWVRTSSTAADRGGRRPLRRLPQEPEPDAGPERIAEYVVSSIPRLAIFLPGKGRWSDSIHGSVVALLDELIEMDNKAAMESLLGEFVQSPLEASEEEAPLVLCAETIDALCAHGGSGNRGHAFSIDLPLEEEAAETKAPVAEEPSVVEGPAAEEPSVVERPAAEEPNSEFPVVERPPIGGQPAPAPRRVVRRRPRYNRQRLERSAEVLGGITLVALACAASKRIG